MPKFLEKKLRAEYGNNAHAIYGTMNKIGAMHGNKETAKGREMERKHEADMKAPFHHTHIQHHDDGSHTVTHTPHMKPASKSGAFMHAGDDMSYSAGDGKELVSKLRHNLNLKDTGSESHETEASHEEMGGEAEMDES